MFTFTINKNGQLWLDLENDKRGFKNRLITCFLADNYSITKDGDKKAKERNNAASLGESRPFLFYFIRKFPHTIKITCTKL